MSIWIINRDYFHNNEGNIDTDTDTFYDICYHWYGNTTTPVATAASSVSVLHYRLRLRIGRATLRHLRLIYGPPHDDSSSVSVLSTVQPNNDWVHILRYILLICFLSIPWSTFDDDATAIATTEHCQCPFETVPVRSILVHQSICHDPVPLFEWETVLITFRIHLPFYTVDWSGIYYFFIPSLVSLLHLMMIRLLLLLLLLRRLLLLSTSIGGMNAGTDTDTFRVHQFYFLFLVIISNSNSK